ncbi:hypothetical protein A374_00305 [Fictibacillus macauensis ZFHKF-1]|uniref:Isochorismatase-like domain-containing protein n=1 Tax=Fictibacillus macauensis ZFHKF-1 TaxID=1196324 RepID=I8ANH7_9BACL|nr:isochorismatase family protein [Fictibacillus macauensis]EIT87369.1 hypothetical protein A374_00305 [Fictibacillus macauensis ZFHKF-1]
MNQVLIVIDAQQALIEGMGEQQAVYNKEQLLQNINLVIATAQTLDVPVIFVRDLDVAAGVGAGFEVHEALSIPADSVYFNKKATNAFYGTGLLEHLQQLKIQHLVIMGCATQHCIDSAVRTATISGFDVTLVGDGHSTTDHELLSAEQIIAHHNKTLHGHYNVDHFAIVRKAAEDVFTPTHDHYRD